VPKAADLGQLMYKDQGERPVRSNGAPMLIKNATWPPDIEVTSRVDEHLSRHTNCSRARA
jgi:hypothetical protein